MPQAGQLIAGKYRIEGRLGRGGMGIVLVARHIDLDDLVAIKVMLPAIAVVEEQVERFLREARATRKLKSEHIVRVLDVGTCDGSGDPFIVMELLAGADLSMILTRHGSLPVEVAGEYALQACEGLAEAHALGVIHRDIKPSNLFLTQYADGSPCIKILDFGIAKLPRSTERASAITRTSMMLGTMPYASPEQLQSAKHVDHRTDIWSLGVTLYELVSGKYPFIGDDLPERVAQILSMPPTPLREVRPDVDPEFEALVMRCLEKDRDRRFASIGELALALRPLVEAARRPSIDSTSRARDPVNPILSPPPAAGIDAPLGTLSEPAHSRIQRQIAPAAVTPTRTRRRRSRRRTGLTVGTVAICAGFSLAGSVVPSRSASTASPASSAAPSLSSNERPQAPAPSQARPRILALLAAEGAREAEAPAQAQKAVVRAPAPRTKAPRAGGPASAALFDTALTRAGAVPTAPANPFTTRK